MSFWKRKLGARRIAAVLARMGQQALPPTPQPGGLYVPTVRDGRLLYVSGHAPYDGGGDMITGLCSSEEDVEAAHRAAAHNALSILSTLTATLGGLGGVKRLIKSLCMVNCAPGFGYHPEVMNGYR